MYAALLQGSVSCVHEDTHYPHPDDWFHFE